MVTMHISHELQRRLFLLSNVNVSSAHKAMLWTKCVSCQQI